MKTTDYIKLAGCTAIIGACFGAAYKGGQKAMDFYCEYLERKIKKMNEKKENLETEIES